MAAPATKWFTDARFGMFVHWGLYSIPAGIWDGRIMGRNWYAEWIQKQGNWPHGIPDEDYRALARQFDPVQFDADAWIALAKDAGMKYFLITSKHHDGFALWDSKVSDYTICRQTPFKRDVLAELREACRKHGIVIGYYYSHWQDWDHIGGAKPPWPPKPGVPPIAQPSDEQFQQYWDEKCIPQVRELVADYGAEFLWFDTWRKAEALTPERLETLIAAVKDINPACLVNSRIGTTWNHPKGDELVDYLSMGDNQFPDHVIAKPWETSGTFNRSWGYHQRDHKWHSARELIRMLIDNASRNGNFQLNIGPMGNGAIPAASIKRLKEVGAWIDINGEAIYASMPYPGKEPEWGRITMKHTNDGMTELYCFVYDFASRGQIEIPELEAEVGEAVVIETGEALSFEQRPTCFAVTVPEFCPDETAFVIKVTLKQRLVSGLEAADQSGEAFQSGINW